jgi:GWxTD domain-containing protein
MTVRLLATFCLLVFLNSLSAINVNLSNYTFKTEKLYSEVYLRIDGTSIQWKQIGQDFSASIQAIIYISDSSGQIVAHDKFAIQKSGVDTISDIISIRRYFIPDGKLLITVELNDLSDEDNSIKLEQKLASIRSNSTMISSIIPLEVLRNDVTDPTLTKNGYYLEPLPYHFVDKTKSSLNFYQEVYFGDNQTEEYVVKYSITDALKSDFKAITKAKKIMAKSTVPLILNLPVSNIVTGDYFFEVSILDKTSKVIASQKVDLSVSNPIADLALLNNYNKDISNAWVNNIKEADMEYILRAHVPIVSQKQSGILEQLIKDIPLKSCQHFIYQFWTERNPSNPETAYNGYMEVAKAVDKRFNSNTGYGFQTDRGHMFLKHGKPDNIISIDTEIDAPPYEIWYYNRTAIVKQTNVRFLFYNPSLVQNDYHLLHSNCYGERSNPFWERELYKTNQSDLGGNPMDNPQASNLGTNDRNARRYFNEF